MKKIIAKILIKFITKYNLYALIGDGKDKYLEITDMPVLFPKDDKWHKLDVRFYFKKSKKKIYLDRVLVKI